MVRKRYKVINFATDIRNVHKVEKKLIISRKISIQYVDKQG